jgi:GDP-L-fucose synthase
MKKIITGGLGLVGSAFDSQSIKLSSKDLNLLHFDDSKQQIKSFNPDAIIHCAAKVGGLYGNIKYPADFFDENILLNSNILKISKDLEIKNFIGFLSTCIFPDNLGKEYSEEDLHKGPPHDSNFAYAYAKRMLDIQVRAYNTQYGLNYFNIIPTNIYGPNDNFNIENGHVIPGLIHKLWNAKQNNTPLIVFGSGIAVREFIFSSDVAKICTILLENYDDVSPIIISNSQEEFTIKQIVEMIVEISNFKGEVIFDTSKSDGQLVKKTDNSKLLSIIGDFQFTSMEVGLKKTIEWFFNNYERARK